MSPMSVYNPVMIVNIDYHVRAKVSLILILFPGNADIPEDRRYKAEV